MNSDGFTDWFGSFARLGTLWLVFSVACPWAMAQGVKDNSNYGSESSDKAEILSFSLDELLKVKVVTASKNQQNLADAPSIISVVTADEMKRLGVTKLIDVLRLLPGFSPVIQLQSDRVMVVRGLALQDGVLVLQDGVPLNDAFDGGFDFYERSVVDLERIEVVRGPGSALYGSYAVSAVIQLFTHKPKAFTSSDYQLSISSGSFTDHRLTITGAQDLSAWVDELKVSASFAYQQKQGDQLMIVQDSLYRPSQAEFLAPLINPTLTPTERQEEMETFNAHANFSLGSWTASFSHQQIITSPLVSHKGVVTDLGTTTKDSVQDSFSLNNTWLDQEQLKLQSRFYWLSNESKLFGQSQPPQIHGDEDQDGLNEVFLSGIIENFRHKTQSYGAELEFNWSAYENHELLFGLVYDNTQLDDANKTANVSLLSRGPAAIFPSRDVTSEFIEPGHQRKLNSIYVQDAWDLMDKANLTLGIRYGDYSDFGSTLNPRVGFIYRLNPKLYSKLLYGEAFKPPAFSQLFDKTPTLSASRIRGNEDLQPTEIESHEWQLGYHHSDILHSNLTLFEADTSNEIFFNAQPGIEKWQNSGQHNSKGIELEVKGQFWGLDYAFINYSYQKTKGVEQGVGANIHPAHRLNFAGSNQLSDQFALGFNLSSYSSPEREMGDSRPRIDAKYWLGMSLHYESFDFPGLELQLIVNNLLDQDARYEVDSTVGLKDDIPLEGRGFLINASYLF